MVKVYVVTMQTGVAKQLSSVLGVNEDDLQRACVWMQPRGTNTNLIYLGDSAVTSTNYGLRLEIPVGGVPQAPFNPGEFSTARGYGNKSPVKLSDFWVLGTTGDFLQLLVLTY